MGFQFIRATHGPRMRQARKAAACALCANCRKYPTFDVKWRLMTPDTCPTMDAQRRTGVETRVQEAVRAMHTCPSCNSAMVQPTNWHEQGDTNWHVELRCPECE